MATEKTCFKCLMTKPLTDFYKHPYMADGHLGKCKECAKRDAGEHQRDSRDGEVSMISILKDGGDFATQAGHYYRPDGTPAYTVTGKNGKERPTTIRDAREHGLLPSVTTICSVVAKPGLENWKIDQAIMSALTATRLEGESDMDFIARVKRDAKEEASRAAEFGTTIHGQIERHYRGELVDPAYRLFVDGVVEEVDRYFPGFTWYPERSFAHNGYGGKVDLHGSDGKRYAVIDFKGKDGPLDEVETYPEHWMQLSAYWAGLFPESDWSKAEVANCFFSRTHPGKAFLVLHSLGNAAKGWEMFCAAKALWCAMKGYNP